MEALPRHPEHALPWRAFGLGCAAIVVLLCIAYAPVTRAGFIWDDDSYVTKNANVQSPDGVFRFWIPRETPQFYPLVFSSFWVEFQLWGLDPLGYHIVNVVLHGINAILLWLILIRLRIPGAFVVAALFAVHPIHVESVAWITERKNVLSGMFYLLGMLSYLRFEENLTSEPRRSAGGWYGLAFVAYVAALLSKTITCSLPAALLLIMFWQRRPLNTARIMRIMPFFLIGIPLALITVWLERDHVGASGVDFDQSFLERCAIASRSLLFYAGKIAVPYELAFFYHRWTIQGINLVSGLAMLTVLSVAITSIVATKRGWRAPFVLLALFAGTAFPALGFFNVYP
ncbi:MAG: O-GlcNAc transferase, partial [Planctomycetota bacterium]